MTDSPEYKSDTPPGHMPDNLVRRTPWPDSVSRAVVTPLQPSVVYASPTPDALDAQYDGKTQGFTYSREGHPNARVLAQKLDMMERAPGGIVVSSGMAAVAAALFGLLKQGDHVVAGNQLYGRSLRMMTEQLPRLGIAVDFADPTDGAAMTAAIRPDTRMVLVETVSNPTLRIADMPAIIAACKAQGALLAVDNTFTTPRAYKPLVEGADIVIHSVTKLLSGHADAMLGYVAAARAEHQAAIDDAVITMGFTPSPFDCWLAERGLYTFDLRFDRAQDNAARLAGLLAGLPGVAQVFYPGRNDHPDHNRAAGVLNGVAGNMVSFVLDGGREAANRLTAAVPDLAFAPTLGDVGTTLSHPASSSHRALGAEGRARLGISEGFFRVSTGIEPIELILSEFTKGVAAARG